MFQTTTPGLKKHLETNTETSGGGGRWIFNPHSLCGHRHRSDLMMSSVSSVWHSHVLKNKLTPLFLTPFIQSRPCQRVKEYDQSRDLKAVVIFFTMQIYEITSHIHATSFTWIIHSRMLKYDDKCWCRLTAETGWQACVTERVPLSLYMYRLYWMWKTHHDCSILSMHMYLYMQLMAYMNVFTLSLESKCKKFHSSPFR